MSTSDHREEEMEVEEMDPISPHLAKRRRTNSPTGTHQEPQQPIQQRSAADLNAIQKERLAVHLGVSLEYVEQIWDQVTGRRLRRDMADLVDHLMEDEEAEELRNHASLIDRCSNSKVTDPVCQYIVNCIKRIPCELTRTQVRARIILIVRRAFDLMIQRKQTGRLTLEQANELKDHWKISTLSMRVRFNWLYHQWDAVKKGKIGDEDVKCDKIMRSAVAELDNFDHRLPEEKFHSLRTLILANVYASVTEKCGMGWLDGNLFLRPKWKLASYLGYHVKELEKKLKQAPYVRYVKRKLPTPAISLPPPISIADQIVSDAIQSFSEIPELLKTSQTKRQAMILRQLHDKFSAMGMKVTMSDEQYMRLADRMGIDAQKLEDKLSNLEKRLHYYDQQDPESPEQQKVGQLIEGVLRNLDPLDTSLTDEDLNVVRDRILCRIVAAIGPETLLSKQQKWKLSGFLGITSAELYTKLKCYSATFQKHMQEVVDGVSAGTIVGRNPVRRSEIFRNIRVMQEEVIAEYSAVVKIEQISDDFGPNGGIVTQYIDEVITLDSDDEELDVVTASPPHDVRPDVVDADEEVVVVDLVDEDVVQLNHEPYVDLVEDRETTIKRKLIEKAIRSFKALKSPLLSRERNASVILILQELFDSLIENEFEGTLTAEQAEQLSPHCDLGVIMILRTFQEFKSHRTNQIAADEKRKYQSVISPQDGIYKIIGEILAQFPSDQYESEKHRILKLVVNKVDSAGLQFELLHLKKLANIFRFTLNELDRGIVWIRENPGPSTSTVTRTPSATRSATSSHSTTGPCSSNVMYPSTIPHPTIVARPATVIRPIILTQPSSLPRPTTAAHPSTASRPATVSGPSAVTHQTISTQPRI